MFPEKIFNILLSCEYNPVFANQLKSADFLTQVESQIFSDFLDLAAK